MILERLDFAMTICKVTEERDIPLGADFCFAGKTDEEISLVCPTADVPGSIIERDDGWRGFRVRGTLDFSLIGILAKISTVLADEGIGMFVVSTFNTDYILVRQENFSRAGKALADAGYEITG